MSRYLQLKDKLSKGVIKPRGKQYLTWSLSCLAVAGIQTYAPNQFYNKCLYLLFS